MRTNNNAQQSELINTRVIELETELEKHDDYRKINEEQYTTLLELKKIVGERNWLVLDDFVCSKNAECEYIKNYFYINGIDDGKNIFN